MRTQKAGRCCIEKHKKMRQPRQRKHQALITRA